MQDRGRLSPAARLTARSSRGTRRIGRAALAWAVPLILAGCVERAPGEPTAQAADVWTRTYPLVADGAIDISTRAGSVTIEASDDTTVEIRAERRVLAATEADAREILPRIAIEETVNDDGVTVRAGGLAGMVIGVEVEVDLRVRAPRGASVRALSRRGPVTVNGFRGAVTLTATNGSIKATALEGGVVARATNGSVALALDGAVPDPIDVRATNGSIELFVPASAPATVQASITNGSFDIEGLPFEAIGERTQRRVRGRINRGGTPIELVVVNGKIRIGPSPSSAP